MSKIARQPNLPPLTGLRFWAAFFILLNHLLLGFIARDNPALKNMLGASGILGMNTFFVLSGFIIHYNYHEKLKHFNAHSFFEFFVARFSRLYPLYIVLFLLELVTVDMALQGLRSEDVIGSLKYFLTMSQSWFYKLTSTGQSVTYMYPRSSISWSISTEMLMYSFYPALLLLFRRDRSSHWLRLVVVAGLVLLFSLGLRWLNNNMDVIDRYGVSLFGQNAGMGRNVSYSFAFWFVFISPYVRVFEFIIGAMTAHLFLRLRDHAPGKREQYLVPLLGLVSMLYIMATFLPDSIAIGWLQVTHRTIGYYPALAIIIFVAARHSSSFVSRYFSINSFVRLGEYSYSIYLFHIFVYSASTHASALGVVVALRIVILWATVFASAHVLYRFIEMPWRKKVRDGMMAGYPFVLERWRKLFY